MPNSRLQRQLEKQTKRKLWLTVIGIILVLVLLVRYGIPLLINFTLFLTRANPNIIKAQKNSGPDFVEPPTLDNIVSATSSAQIKVTGSASAHEKISLYVNDSLADETNTKDDGSFEFNNVSLQQGNNTVKAKAENNNNKQSDFSDEQTIVYKNSAPKLDVSSPQDGQTFSKDDNNINVTGSTDSDAKITVNDFWAINNDGNFTYNLHLQNGDNQIKIIATDTAGNKTEKDLKVTYSQ